MNINFVPVELRPKRPSKAPYLFVAMAYVFALLFMGAKVGVVRRIGKEVKSDQKLLATLSSNLSTYAGADQRLEKITSEINELGKKMESIKGISRKTRFGVILHEVGNLIPEGLWFEELSIDHSSDELRLIGFGFEPAEEKAVKFAYSLEGSEILKKFFSEAKLVSSSPVPEREGQGSFDIEMVFRK